MNNHPESFCVDVITYPCHNPDADLTNLCQEICSVNNLRRTNAGELYDMQLLSGVPDYFGRNKISSGGDLSHYSSASLY